YGHSFQTCSCSWLLSGGVDLRGKTRQNFRAGPVLRLNAARKRSVLFEHARIFRHNGCTPQPFSVSPCVLLYQGFRAAWINDRGPRTAIGFPPTVPHVE